MHEALRFPSDLTDAEWAVLAPLLPNPSPVGRPPRRPMREILNAIFYVLRGRHVPAGRSSLDSRRWFEF